MKRQYFDSIDQLSQFIKTHEPSIYLGSQTSTVIPFENLPAEFQNLTLCYLEKLPQHMNLLPNGDLEISGSVNWKEARSFLQSQGRDLLTFPTEELAAVIAGIATSATGERCFGFGTFRSQVKELEFIDFNGDVQKLSRDKTFSFGDKELRSQYQEEAQKYSNFKNPPFPNFNNQIDLMMGTEGQLGVVTKAVIETKKMENTVFVLIPMKIKWSEDFTNHLKVYEKVQSYRDQLICVELLDYKCINYLSQEDIIPLEKDYIVFEVREDSLESIFENLIMSFDFIDLDSVVELSGSRFMQIRQKIPRTINEKNSRAGIKKLGTDIQAMGDEFSLLLAEYQRFNKSGIEHCLFGHFGDAHLHFNFMPKAERASEAKQLFVDLYKKLSTRKVSPFAEHGIGVIKQDFIRDYYSPTQLAFFKSLKSEFDPHNQFFHLGFMNIS